MSESMSIGSEDVAALDTGPRQLYRCDNVAACPLGTRGDPGYFTDGISADYKNAVTGQPVEQMVEGDDYGPGVCPSCGEKGTPVGTTEEGDTDA